MEVREVIIYSIKEEYESQVSTILGELRELVKNFSGLKKIESYHTCDDSLKLMDLVTWETKEDALNAMKKVKTEPKYEKINSYFEEVSYFNHFYFFM